ncbi:hypothetical protein JOF29_008283 [Kribbella aluminosa]|uniref:DUF2332 domain-containing protein n=1 Tax=Kribbella aluminosa TaxID=416017 RepID=A0ABS4V011_9ACTN|nr:DUF2332 domain-containing protein [Kribbella aluminosa]MBP2357173.1 hypothetical protein [Kribbella aluminosa]
MPGPSDGTAGARGRGRALAEVYRRFGESEKAKGSPLYGQIAIALSSSEEALRVIETAPARRRNPTLVLAALHDVALAGQAPALASAFTAPPAAPDPTPGTESTTSTGVSGAAVTGPRGRGRGAGGRSVGEAAVEVMVGMAELVLERLVGRKVRGDEGGRHAVLYPAVAEVARRVGAGAVGLIDVGRSAGLNLVVDRVGISYGNGQLFGDAGSGVQASASVVRGGLLPSTAMPEVMARVAVGDELVDVTDADEARWLRACVPPDQVERLARLEAELALAAADPPVMVPGAVLDVLPEAIARVPDGVLPVVMTTWVLSSLDLEERLRFLQRLDEAATRRTVAWVSVEGVGVAPGVPTYGDRRASGHSILGVSVFEHSSLHATGVGRCWLRGEMLAWLAGTSSPADR